MCQLFMRVMTLFSTYCFAKCLRVDEDGRGRGHLCHIDIFLVFLYMFHMYMYNYTGLL